MMNTFHGLCSALDSVQQPIEPAVEMIREAKEEYNTVFFIGNGGSAAIAAHMAADFAKAAKVRTRCFNDAPSITAIANDVNFKEVFASQIDLHAEPHDVLVAISSSGKSGNILFAIAAARKLDMQVITLSGFEPDNPLRSSGDINFYVKSDQYGLVEVTHHAICHAILDTLIDDR